MQYYSGMVANQFTLKMVGDDYENCQNNFVGNDGFHLIISRITITDNQMENSIFKFCSRFILPK